MDKKNSRYCKQMPSPLVSVLKRTGQYMYHCPLSCSTASILTIMTDLIDQLDDVIHEHTAHVLRNLTAQHVYIRMCTHKHTYAHTNGDNKTELSHYILFVSIDKVFVEFLL